MTEADKKVLNWVDCAKFVAIFAVMIDHTKGILYSNQDIAEASYFATSLFVLISGFLNYLSNERHNYSYAVSVKRSCKRIVVAYIVATLVYMIVADGFFDLEAYIYNLIHFCASWPLYYVSLYIQLMLISKLLYGTLKSLPKRHQVICEIGFGAVLVVIASFTTRYTNILGILGGGGKLFGGTYLILFYVGMLFARHHVFDNTDKVRIVIIFVLSAVMWIVWWRLMCAGIGNRIDSALPFGDGFNPPGLVFCISAVITIFLTFGFFTLCTYLKAGNILVSAVGRLGRHSLYIFLYHRLWLDYFLKENILIENRFLRAFVYIGVMICFSIFLEYILGVLSKAVLSRDGRHNKV